MPSPLFFRVRSRAEDRQFAQVFTQQFQTRIRTQQGTVSAPSKVTVGTMEYDLVSDTTYAVGRSLTLVNVGRKAAARYSPATAAQGGSTSTGGGSGVVETDVSGKADKVSGSVYGYLAALDATGNLMSSGLTANEVNNITDTAPDKTEVIKRVWMGV